MKRIVFTLAFVLCFGLLSSAQLTTPPNGNNQKSVTGQYIGPVSVYITYNSPDVTSPQGQDRTGKIWGQLVPYGLQNLGFGNSSAEFPSPWRAGANENTVIKFSHDVLVEGKPLKAGKYGLHMIPSATDWTVIFSKEYKAWGSYFYKEADDALRVTVKPHENEFHEWLDFEFVDRQPSSATFELQWEKLAVPVKIEVPNVNQLYVDIMEKELQSGPSGFSWQAASQAANFAASNGIELEKAMKWAEAAISSPFFGQKNFTTMSTKANVLIAMKNEAEAGKVLLEAVDMPDANIMQVHQLGRSMIMSGDKEMALQVFQKNAANNPNTWPVDFGLARGYSANGDYAKALKHAKIALERAPNKPNKDALVQFVEKLKKGEDIN